MITITASGVTIDVPATGELDLDEWRWIKHATGLNMFELEEAISNADPDAWWALLVLGARRSGVDEEAVGSFNMLEVVTSIGEERRRQEEAEEAGAEGNAVGGEGAAPADSALPTGPSPATILTHSGTPLSLPATESIPG